MSRLYQHLKPVRRQLLCAAGLLPVNALVYVAAYLLRFEGRLGDAELEKLSATLCWVVMLKLVVFGWMRIYQGWSRYVTFHDLVSLTQAATISSLLLALGDFLFIPSLAVPRSVFLMDWGMTIVVISALRGFTRLIDERGRAPFLSNGKTPVFIVGTNDSGEALLRSIRRNHKLPYRVVGFITADDMSLGARIGGVPVVGSLDQTCQRAARYGVAEVLVTAGELTGMQMRSLIDSAGEHRVSVKVLPSYDQLLHGQANLRPRTVSIEDLLRRDPVDLDTGELLEWIEGRVLLVTGSAGSIGSEICRQLLQFAPRRLVLVDRSENGQFYLERALRQLAPQCDIELCVADVTDQPRMDKIFRTYRPDIVFHAAAYKHVPLMERNSGEAVKNIVLATRSLADLAHRHRVGSFVMVSTDKAVNPTSIMGACKRVAELYVQALAKTSRCQFVTVRFGNVLDSAGSVVPIFREQIASGGPVTVTHAEMQRFFMTIPEASQLVIQAGAMGQGGEVFVLDMGEPVRIVDLAADMIRLSGLELHKDIDIEFVGPRPGEKLFEELHMGSERHVTTSHPKIMVAVDDGGDPEAVFRTVDSLARLAECQRPLIVAQLQQLVPQFVPSAATPRRRAA